MHIQLASVLRNIDTLAIRILQRIYIRHCICGKQDATCATFLTCRLTQTTNSGFYCTHIIDNSFDSRIVIYMIQDMLYIHILDIQELALLKRRIQTHYAEVRTTNTHHLACRIHIQECYWLFITFLCIRELFKHAHLKGFQDLTTCTS